MGKERKMLGSSLRVDLPKAYDTPSWNFLDPILQQMSFRAKWRSWIFGCLNSSKLAVLVNGSPTIECDGEGITMMGPFIHVSFHTVKALNHMMKEAVN